MAGRPPVCGERERVIFLFSGIRWRPRPPSRGAGSSPGLGAPLPYFWSAHEVVGGINKGEAFEDPELSAPHVFGVHPILEPINKEEGKTSETVETLAVVVGS
jgi:hypothetical protein